MKITKYVTVVMVLAISVLPELANSGTLHDQCDEQYPLVQLKGSNQPHGSRIWNATCSGVEGVECWNYEGTEYPEVEAGSNYKGTFNVTLTHFACSNNFNFYYNDNNTDAIHGTTERYVDQVATQLEKALTAFQDHDFSTPRALRDDFHRYTPLTEFTRIPVMIFKTPNDQCGGNEYPSIRLHLTLPSDSRGPHHELFHVIRHGYTHFGRGWLNEGLARWSEQFVVDADPPCDGKLGHYLQTTSTLFNKKYCDSAPFFEYLGVKYGDASKNGANVVLRIFSEMSQLTAQSTDIQGMAAIDRAVDHFRGVVSSTGRSYKEWAVGNYVDDTSEPAVLRQGAPLSPRWTEAGDNGNGGNEYVWHNFGFYMPSRGKITIQVRAAAGYFGDRDTDDDDLRFRLDETLLGGWNSSKAFNGYDLKGKIKTLHIHVDDVSKGWHTLSIEADEYPVLYAVNVFEGEVRLLKQDGPFFKSCPPGTKCFAKKTDPPLRSTTFNVPASGVSGTTLVLVGQAHSEYQNEAAGFDDKMDDIKIRIDGRALNPWDNGTNSDRSLGGDYLDYKQGAVEIAGPPLTAGNHTLKIYTAGRPYINHVALFETPASLPLLRFVGGRLDSWSMNYHVIPVTSELLSSGRSLIIGLGALTWNYSEKPSFNILLIDDAGHLVEKRTRNWIDPFNNNYIRPEKLSSLGVGGRVAVVAATAVPSGTYFVRVTR